MFKVTGSWRGGTLIILVLIVVAAVAFVVYQSVVGGAIKRIFPETGVSVVFTELGSAERFTLSGARLVRDEENKVGTVRILESVPSPLSSGEQIVLALDSESGDTIVGVLKNGTVQNIIADASLKSDLTVTDGGVVVYAVHIVPVIPVPPEAAANDSASAAEEGEGSATGPVAGSIPYKTEAPLRAGSRTQLFALDLKNANPAPRLLGPGANPRAVGNESVLAISPEGVTRINAATGARETVVSNPGGNALGSGISKDGSVAALRTEGNQLISLYRVVGTESSKIGTLYSADPVFGIAIVDEAHIFVRNTLTGISFYGASTNPDVVTPVSAHLTLLKPLQ